MIIKNRFLEQCKNIISPTKKKEKTLMKILTYLKETQAHQNIEPSKILAQNVEKIAPGAKLLPYVRAGKVYYTPGKIKQTSATYKSLKWILEEVKNPHKKSLPVRFAAEITNIQSNVGAAIGLKRIFIKEIRAARLNKRRRRYFNKFLKKKNYFRKIKLTKRKNKTQKKPKKQKKTKKPMIVRGKKLIKWQRLKRNQYLKRKFPKKSRSWYKKTKTIRWNNQNFLTFRKKRGIFAKNTRQPRGTSHCKLTTSQIWKRIQVLETHAKKL